MLQVLHLFVCTERGEAANQSVEESSPVLFGKRVLLAEDNEMNREIVVELLQMQEIQVDAVENGQMAVDAFRASGPEKYDAVLMDIQMPVLNGYDAATAIRGLAHPDAKTVPIIALTSDAFAADVIKARSCGMNDHRPHRTAKTAVFAPEENGWRIQDIHFLIPWNGIWKT